MVGICAAGMSASSGVATLGALASDCGSALDASVSLVTSVGQPVKAYSNTLDKIGSDRVALRT